MAELIDAEVVRLEAHLAALNPAERARSRDEASLRALFDPERDATAARKYEAAAERAMYWALGELKEMTQAEALGTLNLADQADAVPPYEAQANDLATLPELAGLASFCPERVEAEPEAAATVEPAPPRPRPCPRPRL